MDRAKTLKDGREITVFAHDLSSKGRKRVTHGARFKCPYCGRPVDLAALDSTKVTTYFKHHRNDELAKFCDEYVSSNGSGNLLMRNPVVPIFLDLEGESTKRYVLKTGLYGIGKRLRSDLKKTTEAYMSVNGRTYPLWQMAAESLRIPIRKLPTLELSNEITVMAPESIRRRIGEAEDCRSGMVFTSDYDSAPPNHANHIGIRIRRGNDVYVGRRYYLVIDSREPKLSKSVATSFDTAKKSESLQQTAVSLFGVCLLPRHPPKERPLRICSPISAAVLPTRKEQSICFGLHLSPPMESISHCSRTHPSYITNPREPAATRIMEPFNSRIPQKSMRWETTTYLHSDILEQANMNAQFMNWTPVFWCPDRMNSTHGE